MRMWTVGDVMTRDVISVDVATPYRGMVDLLVERRISALPVLGDDHRVVGVVSETDLLRKIEFEGDGEPRAFESRQHRAGRHKATARTAAGLMSAPPVVVTPGTPVPEAARIMDQAHVKRLPVVDDSGRPAGIVTRGDLLKVHLRADRNIRADIEAEFRGAFLTEQSDVTVAVAEGRVSLNGWIDRRSSTEIAARLPWEVAGVVDVISRLSYRFDDRLLYGDRLAFGTPGEGRADRA